jgi:hypothetical protein
MNRFAVVLLLFFSGAAVADIYKWVAPDGSVHYGDVPVNGAERLKVPAGSPPTPPPVATPSPEPPDGQSAPAVKYVQVGVQRPRSGEYVREEGEGISVAAVVQPPLRIDQGHVVRFVLDGSPQGPGTPALTQRLTPVERGRHSLKAQVLSADGRVLIESRAVGFFYQRPSHAFTAPGLGPPTGGPVGLAPQAPRFQPFPRAPNVPPAPPQPGRR